MGDLSPYKSCQRWFSIQTKKRIKNENICNPPEYILPVPKCAVHGINVSQKYHITFTAEFSGVDDNDDDGSRGDDPRIDSDMNRES